MFIIFFSVDWLCGADVYRGSEPKPNQETVFPRVSVLTTQFLESIPYTAKELVDDSGAARYFL